MADSSQSDGPPLKASEFQRSGEVKSCCCGRVPALCRTGTPGVFTCSLKVQEALKAAETILSFFCLSLSRWLPPHLSLSLPPPGEGNAVPVFADKDESPGCQREQRAGIELFALVCLAAFSWRPSFEDILLLFWSSLGFWTSYAWAGRGGAVRSHATSDR